MIRVIDLFAGPGGLSEGISAFKRDDEEPLFKIALSIEKDQYAQQTLELRSFVRQFSPDSLPPEYYDYLRGEISKEYLFACHQEKADRAKREAWLAELGVTDAVEVDQRITEALGKSKQQDKWMLIGGPPCQAYSIVGRSRYAKIWRDDPEKRENDERHFLYKEYLRILAAHHPPVFVMENVKGLLSSKVSGTRIAGLIFDDLKEPSRAFDTSYERIRYNLYSFVSERKGETLFGEPSSQPKEFVIRCEKYGIPQARHRVIILGIRSDLNARIRPLNPEKPTSLSSLIYDLPKLRSGISRATDSAEQWKSALQMLPANGFLPEKTIDVNVFEEIKIQLDSIRDDLSRGGEFIPLSESTAPSFEKEWFCDPRLKGVCNHYARSHMVTDLYRYLFASCYAKVKKRSPKLSDYPETLLPDHDNVNEGINDNKFSDRFRVQLTDRPATTITSHISKDGHYFIHPDPSQCRSLTVREAARLQTFPDNYLFVGSRTEQYKQVGNAVPPLLAHKLAERIYRLFQDAELE